MSASFSLSSDETYASGSKVKYRFRFWTQSGVQYTVSWKVRTYYDSGGSFDSPMSATVTGTGGEVVVGEYEISPPGQNGSATVVDSQVSYQSPWNPATLITAPSLGMSANSPGNQCIGTVVSVTANVSTSNGTKTHSDNCGNSETVPLVLSSPAVIWTVTGVSANPSSGTGSTATFTQTTSGTCTVTFNATATTTDPSGTYSASAATSFTVVGLDFMSVYASDGALPTTYRDANNNHVTLFPYTSSTTAKIYASLNMTPAGLARLGGFDHGWKNLRIASSW